MEVFGALRDIKITEDGDLSIKNGDLQTVSGIEWFIQEVNKILKTSKSEWLNHPNIGVGLEEFSGKPNNRTVGKQIENLIYDQITAEGLNFPHKLKVRCVPVSRSNINIFIMLETPDTVINVSKLIFDYENGAYNIINKPGDMQPKKVEPDEPVYSEPKNPYLGRIS